MLQEELHHLQKFQDRKQQEKQVQQTITTIDGSADLQIIIQQHHGMDLIIKKTYIMQEQIILTEHCLYGNL